MFLRSNNVQSQDLRYSCLRGMIGDGHAGILYHSANFNESILISEVIIFDT